MDPGFVGHHALGGGDQHERNASYKRPAPDESNERAPKKAAATGGVDEVEALMHELALEVDGQLRQVKATSAARKEAAEAKTKNKALRRQLQELELEAEAMGVEVVRLRAALTEQIEQGVRLQESSTDLYGRSTDASIRHDVEVQWWMAYGEEAHDELAAMRRSQHEALAEMKTRVSTMEVELMEARAAWCEQRRLHTEALGAAQLRCKDLEAELRLHRVDYLHVKEYALESEQRASTLDRCLADLRVTTEQDAARTASALLAVQQANAQLVRSVADQVKLQTVALQSVHATALVDAQQRYAAATRTQEEAYATAMSQLRAAHQQAMNKHAAESGDARDALEQSHYDDVAQLHAVHQQEIERLTALVADLEDVDSPHVELTTTLLELEASIALEVHLREIAAQYESLVEQVRTSAAQERASDADAAVEQMRITLGAAAKAADARLSAAIREAALDHEATTEGLLQEAATSQCTCSGESEAAKQGDIHPYRKLPPA